MSLDLVLMLSVAVIGGLLAHLLRLPPLVGFLVAGFVLAGLGVTSTPALDTLADLGVVLLLFAIGLKFDVRVLGRREVLGVSVLHAVLSIGLVLGLLAVAGAAGAGLLADVEGTDLVLVALALSFSSTVVAVKVLEEQNATRSLHGRTTIGILVVQDLVAVAALVVVGGETPRWWAPLLLLLVPASWPARRVLARIDHGELLTLVGVTLALVPGYALFDAAGLKGDLGALAVGVLLAPSARAEEVAKAVFSVKELLLVAFFLSVGLHGAPDASGIVLAVVLVALVPVKAALFALLLRASGFRVRTATRAAASLASYSEFALIVVVAAASAGALGPDWLVMVSTAVALSFVVASVTSAAVDRLSSAASHRLPDPVRLHPEERPVDLRRADALVLGMGGWAGQPAAGSSRATACAWSASTPTRRAPGTCRATASTWSRATRPTRSSGSGSPTRAPCGWSCCDALPRQQPRCARPAAAQRLRRLRHRGHAVRRGGRAARGARGCRRSLRRRRCRAGRPRGAHGRPGPQLKSRSPVRERLSS